MTTSRPESGGRRLALPGMQKASAVYLLALIIAVFGAWIPGTFLTGTTFRLVLADQVVVGILALALLVPLIGGAFDLSVGNMLAFSLVIVSWFAGNTEVHPAIASLIAIAMCALVGAISGLLVVRFRVNSFIATLGVSQILSAACLYISDNRQIVGVFSPGFLKLGRAEFLGVPVVVYYLVVIGAVLWYVLECTPLGRHLFAVGSNPEAARLAGVRTDRLVWGALISSAVLAGIAGIVYGAKVGSYSNTFGAPLLFPAFAAVFFGATQFKSRPNVWGTVVAVYTLAFGVKGLQLAFEAGVYWITPLFNGVALVVAVTLASRKDAVKLRRRTVGSSRPPEQTAPSGNGVAPRQGPAATAGVEMEHGVRAGQQG